MLRRALEATQHQGVKIGSALTGRARDTFRTTHALPQRTLLARPQRLHQPPRAGVARSSLHFDPEVKSAQESTTRSRRTLVQAGGVCAHWMVVLLCVDLNPSVGLDTFPGRCRFMDRGH